MCWWQGLMMFWAVLITHYRDFLAMCDHANLQCFQSGFCLMLVCGRSTAILQNSAVLSFLTNHRCLWTFFTKSKTRDIHNRICVMLTARTLQLFTCSSSAQLTTHLGGKSFIYWLLPIKRYDLRGIKLIFSMAGGVDIYLLHIVALGHFCNENFHDTHYSVLYQGEQIRRAAFRLEPVWPEDGAAVKCAI